jgi:hypothetical protein
LDDFSFFQKAIVGGEKGGWRRGRERKSEMSFLFIVLIISQIGISSVKIG